MYLILVFLSLIPSLFATSNLLSITENDPSSFVEGVSMITGDLYTHDEDYVVQGAEPISLRHTYISRGIHLNNFNHLIATFSQETRTIHALEPNGTSLLYLPEPKDYKGNLLMGDYFYGDPKKEKKWKPVRYNPHVNLPGISNTSTGKISAQTVLKNQQIVFDPKQDKKGKSFTLYLPDGTIRRYTGST